MKALYVEFYKRGVFIYAIAAKKGGTTIRKFLKDALLNWCIKR